MARSEAERARLEALWRDPANWKWGMIYHCPADPRFWVPKRLKWAGWTINFAHRLACPVVAGFLLLTIGAVLLSLL